MVRLLASSERIVVFEEGQPEYGFSAELGSALAESGYRGNSAESGHPPIPIPAARSLEADVLPGEVELFDRVASSLLAEIARQS